jgi:hypothetical protein
MKTARRACRLDKNKATTGNGTLNMARARGRMVKRQIIRRGDGDQFVLQAMRHIPRKCFIPEKLQEFAYADVPSAPRKARQFLSRISSR